MFTIPSATTCCQNAYTFADLSLFLGKFVLSGGSLAPNSNAKLTSRSGLLVCRSKAQDGHVLSVEIQESGAMTADVAWLHSGTLRLR
jgi:hypothetical protein